MATTVQTTELSTELVTMSAILVRNEVKNLLDYAEDVNAHSAVAIRCKVDGNPYLTFNLGGNKRGAVWFSKKAGDKLFLLDAAGERYLIDNPVNKAEKVYAMQAVTENILLEFSVIGTLNAKEELRDKIFFTADSASEIGVTFAKVRAYKITLATKADPELLAIL